MAQDGDNPTDAEHLLRLAQAARRGDRQAAADLLRGLQDTIYRFALAQLRDPEAAIDATQETGLRLLKGIDRFEARSRVTTWALGVALNVCREHRRRRPTQSDSEAFECEAGDPGIGSAIETDEEAARLRTAIEGLAPRQREALTLRYYEQLSVAETAEAMGCSAGAVKATVWQALRRLRAALTNEEEPA